MLARPSAESWEALWRLLESWTPPDELEQVVLPYVKNALRRWDEGLIEAPDHWRAAMRRGMASPLWELVRRRPSRHVQRLRRSGEPYWYRHPDDQQDTVLRLDVPLREPWRGPPGWRLEVALGGSGPAWGRGGVSRIVWGGATRMWITFDAWGDDASFFYGDPAPGPLAPLRARRLRPIWEAPEDERPAHWLRLFAEALWQAPSSPLYPGEFRLRWLRDPLLAPPQLVLQGPLGEESPSGRYMEASCQVVFPTRLPSHRAASRVRMWRKRARAGQLPPLLAVRNAALGGYLLLDGHDRWLAAALEGTPPEVVVLNAVRRLRYYVGINPRRIEQRRAVEANLVKIARARNPARFQRAQAALLQFYGPSELEESISRAWPIGGGAAAWAAELLARAAALGPQDEAFAQAMVVAAA